MELRGSAVEGLGSVKVLVAGGTGFVGSNVVHRFLQGNAEVHILTRKNSTLWRIQEIEDQLNLHYGNQSSVSFLERTVSEIRPDVIVNCSGIVKGFDLNDQESVVQSNLMNTVNLTNAALRSNIDTVIHTGSAYECGFSERPITNINCKGDPIGLYGIVKRAETEYIRMVSEKYTKKYITLRLFTPYGFFDSPLRLIPYVITSLILGKIPRINNPGAGRSFIFMNDVSNVYYGIAKAPERFDGVSTVNLGALNLTGVAELVSILHKFFSTDYEVNNTIENENKEYLYPDSNEIMQLLSKLSIEFTPMNDGLAATVNWFRDNIEFYDTKLLTEKKRP